MRVSPSQHVPPGELRSAMVHERLAAGESPASSPRLRRAEGPFALEAGPVTSASSSGTGAPTVAVGDAVEVDMPWREEADAAIAKVEEQHGGVPMSDALRDRVYADFAGRAAGLPDRAGRGLSTTEAWAQVEAKEAQNELEAQQAADAAAAAASTTAATSDLDDGSADDVTDPYGTTDLGSSVGEVSEVSASLIADLESDLLMGQLDVDGADADVSYEPEGSSMAPEASPDDPAGTFDFISYAPGYLDGPLESTDLGSL